MPLLKGLKARTKIMKNIKKHLKAMLTATLVALTMVMAYADTTPSAPTSSPEVLLFSINKKSRAPVSDAGVLLFNYSYSLSGKTYGNAGIVLGADVFDVKNLNFNFLGGVETSSGSVPALGLGFSYQTTWNQIRSGVGLNVHFVQSNKIDFSFGFNLTMTPK